MWDEAVAANMVASGLRCSSATRVATGLPGTGPKPGSEPLVDLVPKTQQDMVLKVCVGRNEAVNSPHDDRINTTRTKQSSCSHCS